MVLLQERCITVSYTHLDVYKRQLPEWAQLLSNFFPLVWVYRFARDVLLRGASFMDCAQDFGGFMIYKMCIRDSFSTSAKFKFYRFRLKIFF